MTITKLGDQLARQFEDHPLGRVIGFFLGHIEPLPKRVDDLADEKLGRRGAGGDSDRPRLPEPFPVYTGGALDQPGGNAHALGHLGEAKRVAAVGCADDQHSVAVRSDSLDRRLPIGGGVADVLASRRSDGREAPLEKADDRRRVVDRQRRLGQKCKVVGVRNLDLGGILDGLDQGHGAGRHLAEGADHLGMAGVADEQDVAPFLSQPLGLAMDLRDERASRIDERQAALSRICRHRLGHAMSGKDYRPVVRNFVELVDEHGAHAAQPINDEAVVDDLMANVDRRAKPLQRELDDLDGAIDARAETAWCSDQDAKGRPGGTHGLPCKRLLAAIEGGSYERRNSRSVQSRKPSPVKLRLLALLAITLLPACARERMLVDGGVFARRSACPILGVPAGTGDITLFAPAGSTDASAIDVTATITNLRAHCNEQGAEIISTATFDVVAVRRDAGPPRQVVLPYFNSVLQGGNQVVAKSVSYVAVNFPAGSQRGRTSAQATVRVSRAAATLPEDVRRLLTQERRPGDPQAAVDPLNDPAVRAAVARATFEQLVGFQLTQDQLRYNATR